MFSAFGVSVCKQVGILFFVNINRGAILVEATGLKPHPTCTQAPFCLPQCFSVYYFLLFSLFFFSTILLFPFSPFPFISFSSFPFFPLLLFLFYPFLFSSFPHSPFPLSPFPFFLKDVPSPANIGRQMTPLDINSREMTTYNW